MKDKDRVELIREGNALFNKGDMKEAKKYFLKANYKDGLIRLGNFYFYEKKLPLQALFFYDKAGCKDKIQEIYDRMVFAIKKLINQDDKPSSENEESKEEVIQEKKENKNQEESVSNTTENQTNK